MQLTPGAGGSVASFRHREFDLMRPMDAPPGQHPQALSAGMFPMVPFVNCLRENRFKVDGQAYEVAPNMGDARLNFHGSGWTLPWQVEAQGDADAVLTLYSGKADPVFAYRARQRFALYPDRLEVTLSVENTGERRMPFSLGLHPWFPRHGNALVRFAAKGVWFTDDEGQRGTFAPSPDGADFGRFRAMPRSYLNDCHAGWDGKAEVCWPDAGIRLTICADKGLSHLMAHVPAHQFDTFCLEPQSAPPCGFDGLDRAEAPPGVFLLTPGAEARVRVVFSVADY
ncbi:aldose 1-epimerase [Oceanibium sediminis]|uniref:aldose 1-epimerase n=1 Tax=Oceanibium sediminis TaxID=2026339 RepID=UPI0013008E3E|nr:aldose 1-epimerase [Oceanibium sediminis]